MFSPTHTVLFHFFYTCFLVLCFVLLCPTLLFPVLFRVGPSPSTLFRPVLFRPVLSCSVLSCPVVPAPSIQVMLENDWMTPDFIPIDSAEFENWLQQSGNSAYPDSSEVPCCVDPEFHTNSVRYCWCCYFVLICFNGGGEGGWDAFALDQAI